jgi:twitching motility protein PilT
MSDVHEDLLIGRLALHYKLITQDQLAEATRQQSREGHQRKLGEILVANGLLTPRRFEQLLAAQREVLAKRQAGGPAPAMPPAPATRPSGGAPAEQAMPALAVAEMPPLAVAPAPPAIAIAPVGQAAPSRGAPAPPPPAPELAGEGAMPARLDRILAYAVRLGASDVHVHSGAPLEMRRHGQLAAMEPTPLDPAVAERAIREILTPEQQSELDRRGQIDLAYAVAGAGRFRANVYRQQRGLDAVFRAIPPRPPTLSDLGLPLSLARFANFHQGLVLITGPAGCGKSSTLAAMLNIVNEERRDHIITVEDPIEVLHPSKRCLVNQRQVGRHTGSFARALRAALREDPDVIAIGELRDLETISLALTAAETGHLVLATLHTNNAIRTINRILGVFPPNQQDQIRTMVSESLRAVVSQRLLPRTDGGGRAVALEVLVANRAVGNLIRENKTFQIKSVLQVGGAHGMCSLDASLAELVKTGAITRDEALRHCDDPTRFGAVPAGAPPAAAASA